MITTLIVLGSALVGASAWHLIVTRREAEKTRRLTSLARVLGAALYRCNMRAHQAASVRRPRPSTTTRAGA